MTVNATFGDSATRLIPTPDGTWSRPSEQSFQPSADLLAALGTFINARLVMRLGMRRIARGAYAMQVGMSGLFLLTLWTGVLPEGLRFPAFFLWAVSVFTMAGLTFGNLNALAMQGMGHLAGMTASVTASVSTLAAVLIAAPVGLAYDGTAQPAAVAARLDWLSQRLQAWRAARRAPATSSVLSAVASTKVTAPLAL